jgi:excisionase family DNA binding protein
MIEEFFLSGSELAATLGIPGSTVYRALREGRLRPVGRTNKEVLFRRENLIDYLNVLSSYLKADQYARCFMLCDQLASAARNVADLRRTGEILPYRNDDVAEFTGLKDANPDDFRMPAAPLKRGAKAEESKKGK